MKIDWKHLDLKGIAAIVCNHLKKNDVIATLVGGACVSIYTKNRYQSWDLDFCADTPSMKKLAKILKELRFEKKSGRHFENPDCKFFIEFVTPPIAVGNECVTKIHTSNTPFGQLRLLTPTDCVKDRLAAYFHWKDQQSLEQAVMVAQSNSVNLTEIKRWAANENQSEKFEVFHKKLKLTG